MVRLMNEGKTEKDCNMSGWSFETLKEYIDERFKSNEQAINKAEAQIDHRFTSVNEFRGALNDLSSRMMPRSEHDIKDKALSDRIDAIDRHINSLQITLTELTSQDIGKKQGLGFVGAIVAGTTAVIAMLVGLITLVFQHGK